MRLHDLSELVGLIYDTALDPDAWPTMLNRLADLLAASSGAQIASCNSRTQVAMHLAPRPDPEYLRSLVEYWTRRDIFRQRGGKSPGRRGVYAGKLYVLRGALSDLRSSLLTTAC
jgi:hypothetical protein